MSMIKSYQTIKKKTPQNSAMTFNVCIGGGEPTLHKRHADMVKFLIHRSVSTTMVINGKLKEEAKHIKRLSKDNFSFHAALSQDKYHEPIDQEVVDMFNGSYNKLLNLYDDGQPTGLSLLHPIGRALKNNLGTVSEDICPSNDVMVKPNGNVCWCSCPDSIIIGNINNRNFSHIFESVKWKPICHKNIPSRQMLMQWITSLNKIGVTYLFKNSSRELELC